MGIFISVPKTIECILTAIVFAVLLSVCCYKPLGILQSGGYSGKKLMGWAAKKDNKIFSRHVLLAMLCALACAVVSLCFSFAGEYAATVGLSAYLLFFILYAVADKKIALKSPAAFTPRFKRLYVLLAFFTAVLVYLAVTLLNFADFIWGNGVFSVLRYCALALFPLLIFPLILFANLVAKIYEVPHNKSFVKKAVVKLSKSDIKVIGITGSYGKTSTKLILTDILSKKYRVLSTPRSHNTPMGVALTVNGANLDEYDFLIAEMGARHVGDIAELCEAFPPDYSAVTGICPQHLESFKTVENVIKAKSEILAYTGISAVIAPECFSSFSSDSCKITSADCVSDISATSEGTEFTLTLGGESKRVKTVLLGRHSAENIGVAAALAYEAGMSLDEIASAVGGINFIEHRLQLLKSNGVNILDDGYNSNIKGAAAALEVLRSFGGRKIVVTPGLVELGVLEKSENEKLGEQLAGLDFVILVGETLILPVKEGYISAGGDPEKLKVKLTLAEAQEELKAILKSGDTVLFLNDLPDIY